MSTVVWHLDRLAAAVTQLEWCAAPRYGEDPPLLRVWHSDAPVVDDSVGVTVCADDRQWFQTSDHRLLAPVGKPVTAATQLIAFLRPFPGSGAP